MRGRGVWPAAPSGPTRFAGPVKQQEPPAQCRRPPRQGDLRRPAGNLKAVIPMNTATATMATFLLGFRTNHRGPSPGNDRWLFPKWKTPRLVVAAGQGWSFSLHPRRPSLRGGVKSETVVELFCRKSPGGVSHLPQRPQRSSPCLIRPPSSRGMFAVFPAVFHRPCEPRSRLRWGLFCSHTPIAQGLPAAQAVCPAGWRWYLAPWGRVPGLPRRP